MLQKYTDRGLGDPNFLVIDGGGPRRLLLWLGGGDLLHEGGSPNRTLLVL